MGDVFFDDVNDLYKYVDDFLLFNVCVSFIIL